MAVIADPSLASNYQRVGMGSGMIWTPGHVTPGPLPVGSGGAYRQSATSGVMSASLSAASEIFQFRYVTAANRVALVTYVGISAAGTVVAGAVSQQTFRLRLARAWTAAGSSGTRLTMTGNNGKLRTSHATSEVNDIGISSTGALVAGTKTFDNQDIGGVSFAILTGAVTTVPAYQFVPVTPLFTVGQGAWPIILANQEGLAITTHSANAFPSGLTWSFTVDIAWMEVDGF